MALVERVSERKCCEYRAGRVVGFTCHLGGGTDIDVHDYTEVRETDLACYRSLKEERGPADSLIVESVACRQYV